MTEEEINIAIATACGKKYHKPTEEEIALGSYYQYEPNYFRSLDEMHEAEKVLTGEQAWEYVQLLAPTGGWCATATQRTEAFLKCLNLWTE